MYQAKSAMFIYCISPVHMGAGTSVGVIDAPIQRERHTNHPSMAGSGIKGAIRHHLFHDGEAKSWLDRYFGPENGSDYAGAVSFSDAQIVLFPARSLEKSFMYVTCPTAVARLIRTLGIAGQKDEKWKALESCKIKGNEYVAPNGGTPVILDSFEFRSLAAPEASKALGELCKFLKANCLPKDPGFEYFQEKLESDVLLISDHAFSYLVRHATSVEPHVKIDDDSGTAKDGGLFYVENLPPETLMVSLFMSSIERSSQKAEGRAMAEEIKDVVSGALDGQLLQFGGDATTGRGLVTLCFV